MLVEGLPRLTPYIKNGVVTQVRLPVLLVLAAKGVDTTFIAAQVLRPVVLKFQSLEARLENPVKNGDACSPLRCWPWLP